MKFLLSLLRNPDDYDGQPGMAVFNQLKHIVIVGFLINLVLLYLFNLPFLNLFYSIFFPLIWEATQYYRYNSILLDSLQDAYFMNLGSLLFFMIYLPQFIFISIFFLILSSLLAIYEQYK
jgi:hypothetical protein